MGVNAFKFLFCCGGKTEKATDERVKLICKGTIHQGELENGGRQCICVALCFLALPSPRTPAEVDHNLMLGTTLYSSMCPNGGYLMPLDFHNTVKNIGDRYFSIATAEPRSGMVSQSDDNLDALAFTLNSAIRLCFQESSTCLLTVGNSPGSTIGIKLGEDMCFVIEDSHSRDSKGRSTSNGKAVVLKVRSKYALVKYIKKMARSLATTDIPFECTPVQICKTNQSQISEVPVSPGEQTTLRSNEISILESKFHTDAINKLNPCPVSGLTNQNGGLKKKSTKIYKYNLSTTTFFLVLNILLSGPCMYKSRTNKSSMWNL